MKRFSVGERVKLGRNPGTVTQVLEPGFGSARTYYTVELDPLPSRSPLVTTMERTAIGVIEEQLTPERTQTNDQ